MYEKLDQVTRVGCLAHIRRKFFEAMGKQSTTKSAAKTGSGTDLWDTHNIVGELRISDGNKCGNGALSILGADEKKAGPQQSVFRADDVCRGLPADGGF